MKHYYLIIIAIFFCSAKLNAGEILQINQQNRHLIPKGKSTDAIDGDWIMKNDKVIAVIGKAVFGREANMRVQSIQGAVIDFTSLEANNDFLAALFPQGIPAEDSRRNPAVFADTIEIIKNNNTEIVLRATRYPNSKSPYTSITEYTLTDGQFHLKITTTYINNHTESVNIKFADKLRMDMDFKDETPALGKHKLAYMYNKWFNCAYGIYRPEGLVLTETPRTFSDPATGLLVGFDHKSLSDSSTVKLYPGEQISATRFLIYGKDVAELQTKVNEWERKKKSIFPIVVNDKNNIVIAKAFVEIFNEQGAMTSFAITNEKGNTEIPLAEGKYSYKVNKIGHDSVSGTFTVTKKNRLLRVIMPSYTGIICNVKEKGTGKNLPVRLVFKGINGTVNPFLGTIKRAEGANNQYYSYEKEFNVPLPPGEYLVNFSHGPEYETITKQIALKPGDKPTLQIELSRMFDSPGWVIADFHNHSAKSGDNDVETRSRVINLAGSGIEFAPATEHNRISSYTDEIKDLALEDFVASAAGIELTGPTGVAGGPNHQNAFPLTIIEGEQGGGFPPINADVYTQLKGLYDYDKDKIKFIQHNHPGRDLPNLFFDKNKDGVIDNGYNTRQFTDAIELQQYAYEILKITDNLTVNKRHPIFYWLQMLNQGDRIYGTTTSDSHMVGERNGLRFVYVSSPTDQPKEIDAYTIAENAKKGRMVMSNGPFLKADINGYLPGEELKKNNKPLLLNIEVYTNNEISINRVQILVNGVGDKKLNFTMDTHPQLFFNNPLQFKNNITLSIEKDAHIIIVATGERKGSIEDLTKRPEPIAITNPFFVDVDNNGFIPSKDTLGEPLPVATEDFMGKPIRNEW